ncbi:MAG: fused MFS/spermidine synthase [Flavobacteriales bacterium]
MLRRLISYLWPIAETRAEGRHGELTVRWEAGTKVLNSVQGNQSFGALHRVWQAVFAHVLLEDAPPKEVLLLGLGGGSVPAILRDERGITARITAIELDPMMVQVARDHFALERHQDLHVILGDATIQVHAIRQRFDLVLVDLFDDLDLARGVDSRAFLHGLRDRCVEGGVVCFNTVAYDAASDRRCQAVHDHALAVFSRVHELRLEDVNRVFILS